MQIFEHPLLVGLKETIKTKNHLYIVTELVNGKDLYEFVRDLKYLNEPEAAYIIQQLIVGVRYLHSLGLVHRDLKPENVMIEYNEQKKSIGKIKIIDFGFANHLSKLKNLTPECTVSI